MFVLIPPTTTEGHEMKRQPNRLLLARELLAVECGNEVASDLIRSFDKLRPRDTVFLVKRVSGRERRANLKDQDANLRAVVKSVGATVVDNDYEYVGSGFDPFWVYEAAQQAKAAGASLLLAETTDRLVRHHLYHSVLRPDAQANSRQLRELLEAADGMPLMTHLHTDASPNEIKSYQVKRGQKYKASKGGRPKNGTPGLLKRRRDEMQRRVLWLHECGWSIRWIAAKRNVPKSTVQRWIQAAGVRFFKNGTPQNTELLHELP
jgi:hypothetical protein